MTFRKGESGNPGGRPKGIRDKRLRYRELLAPHAEALINKAVELAKGGDVQALRLCLERVCAPIRARDEAVEFDLPANGGMTDTGHAILQAAAAGQLLSGQAQQLLAALASQAKLIETDELTRRIEALERQSNPTSRPDP